MPETPTFTRNWAPKRRTGCKTCKIRHTRCDEGKPACQKCLSTGRKCDGYDPVSKHSSTAASSPGPNPISLFPNVPSREHRAFEYFLSCTAPGLAGYFSREIFSVRVPKIGVSESPLWHIVIALSSVHEGYTHGVQQLNRGTQVAQYSLGLKHYVLAVKSLQDNISSQPKNIEPVLLCCMLFVCFDSLRGNYTAALTHLNSGLKILCSEKYAGRWCPSYDKIVEQFACLGLSIGVFVDSHLPDYNTLFIWRQFLSLGSDRDAEEFKTLDDARHSINMVLNDFMLHHVMSLNADESCQYSIRHKPSIIRANLALWNRKLDAMILQNNPANLSSEALRGSILLKLHHATLVAATNESRKLHIEDDELNAPFHTILSLARSLINATPNLTKAKASISFDLGLVLPLFTLISRCTIPELRREALDLLNTVPRREGLWDTEVITKIAHEVLSIEESDNRATASIDEGETGDVDVIKVHELRIYKSEEEFGEMDGAMRVDMDFVRTNRITGQKRLVTETLLI
ncbi:hypothetical protein N431DRAFT_383222 [Stipitochalara longipes BDJ]|nr:hypothetical protein N431DRAFT_383222 [Stipitochalara longipes BDJ]